MWAWSSMNHRHPFHPTDSTRLHSTPPACTPVAHTTDWPIRCVGRYSHRRAPCSPVAVLRKQLTAAAPSCGHSHAYRCPSARRPSTWRGTTCCSRRRPSCPSSRCRQHPSPCRALAHLLSTAIVGLAEHARAPTPAWSAIRRGTCSRAKTSASSTCVRHRVASRRTSPRS